MAFAVLGLTEERQRRLEGAVRATVEARAGDHQRIPDCTAQSQAALEGAQAGASAASPTAAGSGNGAGFGGGYPSWIALIDTRLSKPLVFGGQEEKWKHLFFNLTVCLVCSARMTGLLPASVAGRRVGGRVMVFAIAWRSGMEERVLDFVQMQV